MQSKNAMGNLINRYRAVLKKCHIMNTFGSLAIAGMLVMGSVGVASAEERVEVALNESKAITNTTFEDITIETYGAAIWNAGTLTLENVNFLNNNSTYGIGGAIGTGVNTTGLLSITNSIFDGNTTLEQGGAISHIAGREEGSGMAISNSVFKNNTVTMVENLPNTEIDGGGAIFLGSESHTTIDKTEFTANTSSSVGGAIGMRKVAGKWDGNNKSALLDITASTFTSNVATTYGGAIYNTFHGSLAKPGSDEASSDGYTYIANSTFTTNSAQQGGAIYNVDAGTEDPIGGRLWIANSTFTENTASALGGAIYNAGDLVVEGSSFTGNTSTTKGGAIYNTGNLSITGSTFTNNSSNAYSGAISNENGGAIYTYDADSSNYSITFAGKNIFSGNKAGANLNDIHNLGYINASGDMTLDGGVTGDGIFTIKEGTNLNLTAGKSTTMENTMNVDGKLTIAGGTLNASDINLKGNLWAGELNITDESKSFGDLSTGGTLNVSNLSDINLVGNNYGIYIYDAEYTEADLETLHNGAGTAAHYVGTLVDENGKAETLTADAITTKTTVATGNTVNLADASSLAGNGSTVKNLTTSAENFTLSSGTTTLVGSSDGALVGSASGKAASVSVAAGGTLNVGLAGNTKQAQGGSLGEVALQGKMNVLNASLKMDSLTLSEGSNFFIDPAYVATASLGDVAGDMLIGSGSVMSIGSENVDIAKMKAEVEKLGLTTTATANGGFTVAGSEAVLIAAQAIKITSGKIIVDANMTADGSGAVTGTPTGVDAGDAYFANNSLFIVDADIAKGENVALTGTGTLSVQEGAKLLITDAADGDVINITDDFASGTTDWTVSADSSLLTATGSGNASDYNVTLTKNDVNTVFGNAGLDSELIGMLGNYDGGNSNSFLVKATSTTNIADVNDQANAIEGAAKLGVAGGAISSAVTVSDTGISNVVNRAGMKDLVVAENDSYLVASNSYATDARPQSNDFGLWAMPMYNHTSSNGFESGNYEYGYDTDIYGVTVGGDYTFASNARLGLAFHVGSGSSDSNGHFASTENDFDYLGASLYTGYTWGNVALSADFGYTSTDNEVEQKSLVGHLNSDFDASVITLGARAEYRFQNSFINATPYLGVRYNYTDVDSYDTKHAGATMSSTESTDSSVLTIPMGIEFSKDIVTDSGYTLSPSAGIGVQIAMGDLDVEQRVGFSGVAGTSGIESEVFDPVTFQGALGLEVAKGDFSFDLDYTLDASSNVTSHGVMGTFRYDF